MKVLNEYVRNTLKAIRKTDIKKKNKKRCFRRVLRRNRCVKSPLQE